jgi:hypothetical protein
MKRIFLFLVLLLFALIIWVSESRKIYCLRNGDCVTVWKTYNRTCYIIPGKYYGIVRPSGPYMESPISNLLTIFFSTELPKKVIFQSSEEVKINNVVKNEFTFYDYTKDTSRFDKILYTPNPKNRTDLKADAEMIDINILENYATDKSGKKL